MPPVAQAGARSAHRAAVDRSDRRWLLAWTAVFLIACAAILGVYDVYHRTGPHPQMTSFVRRLKHEARWLIPGLKSRPNFKPSDD